MTEPNPNPLTKAVWIGPSQDECASPMILRRFWANEVLDPAVRGADKSASGKCGKAKLIITGLGYFEASINGVPVTKDRLVPVVSDYEKRTFGRLTYPIHDTFTHRIYYCTYDVSELIRPGENVLSIWLGDGWYRQIERQAEGTLAYAKKLKTIYTIAIKESGQERLIVSDGSETWTESRIRFSQLYLGEIIDAGFADKEEKPVVILPETESELCEQIGVPDRVIRTLAPILCREWEEDGAVHRLYDAGENISGVVRLKASGKAGERITLRFAEVIESDGALRFHSTGSDYTCIGGSRQIMTDVFVCSGEDFVFEPKFVWHAFRYFDVTGSKETLASMGEPEVVVIHSDVPVTARFESSSEGLNFLYEAYIRAQLDNMHGSFPSDCPHRERLGYTGDGQACAKAGMTIFDSREFYRKWIRDILDCQDKVGGHVQHTAPFMGGGGGPGGWGCAIVIVPYQYYKAFGEAQMLKECYEPMRRWLGYLRSRCENGLVVREEEKGWCLGDWCTLDKVVIPEPYVNTCYFVKSLQMMAEIAAIIGKKEDIAEYRGMEQELCAALKREYYDAGSGQFCGGVQGADAYATWIGLNDARTVGALVHKYRELGHFDTGFLGTDILMEVLLAHGYGDVAYELLESEELGSFLYMKRHGATTIWESWNGKASHNHPMFGGCTRQLFEGFLGIGQTEASAGYQEIVIAPYVPDGLEYAKGSIMTVQGEIAVGWKREAGELRFDITIPKGKTARFRYRGTERILESGTTKMCINENEL
ncbi:MAG: family 78 glycoside hydrolase catalytic domain [Lachnospiraceae bacterium]|nr:family 78 glycoside hydrolase catalytic domain [Lachnospiraceae bacterium]